ncbi:unnamed protein product [Urochloa humidicola]
MTVLKPAGSRGTCGGLRPSAAARDMARRPARHLRRTAPICDTCGDAAHDGAQASRLACYVHAWCCSSQVASSLSPCIPYATGSASSLPAGCCSGVRSLNSMARSSSDRQAACRCLKSLATSLKKLNIGTVAGIPGKCGVSVPFPISMSTDCNKYVSCRGSCSKNLTPPSSRSGVGSSLMAMASSSGPQAASSWTPGLEKK